MEKYSFLSDLEKTLVEAFNNNEAQKDAVKKVLLNGIYGNGVIKPGAKHNGNENWVYSLPWGNDGVSVSNEKLGAEVRAIAEGIRAVETIFLYEFPKVKEKQEEVKVKKNPAR